MHKSNYLLQESADTRTNSRSDRTRREKRVDGLCLGRQRLAEDQIPPESTEREK